MNTREAALYLGISATYLRNMRQGQHADMGPECSETMYGNVPGFHYTKEACDTWKVGRKWRHWKRGPWKGFKELT